MKRIKLERLQKELLQLTNAIFNGEISDQRLSGIEISRTKLSPDLGVLKLYFTNIQPGLTPEKINQLLQKSSGYIKKKIAGAHIMRIIPQIIFEHDTTSENVERLDGIFRRIADERRNPNYYDDDDLDTDIQMEDLEDYPTEDDHYDLDDEGYDFDFDEKIPDEEMDEERIDDE